MGARRYEIQRDIDAPADAVWALLTDASTYADWNRAVISIEGPIEVGRKVQLVSTVNPKRTFALHVDEMTAPSRMVWSDGMPLGLFRGVRTYSIDAVDTDRCRFTMVEEYSGPLAGLITRAIPDMSESFVTIADGLQAAAEAAAA